jgi:hypothetical protein
LPLFTLLRRNKRRSRRQRAPWCSLPPASSPGRWKPGQQEKHFFEEQMRLIFPEKRHDKKKAAKEKSLPLSYDGTYVLFHAVETHWDRRKPGGKRSLLNQRYLAPIFCSHAHSKNRAGSVSRSGIYLKREVVNRPGVYPVGIPEWSGVLQMNV